MTKLRTKHYVLLAGAFLAGVFLCAYVSATNTDIRLNYYADTSEEQECFAAINAFRAQNGLQPLAWSEDLASASRDWSRTMRRTGRFQHSSNRNGAGENIARGREDGLYTFNQWRNSPGHRAFLLSRNTTEGAVGQDGTYWTFRARAAERLWQDSRKPVSYACADGTCYESADRLFVNASHTGDTVTKQPAVKYKKRPARPLRNALRRMARR